MNYTHFTEVTNKMLSIKMPSEVAKEVADRLKKLRLQQNWTQEILASRSGVNLHTLRRFEHSGQISFERLLSLAFTLGVISDCDTLFLPKMPNTMKALRNQLKKRQRGKRTSHKDLSNNLSSTPKISKSPKIKKSREINQSPEIFKTPKK